MKKFIYLLIAILVISCNSKKMAPEDILKENVEKKLVSKLNDPSSYEFVSFKVDTLQRELINKRIQDLNTMLKEYRKEEEKNKISILITNNMLKSEKEKQLPKGQIEFSLKYRAKNVFNATVLNEIIVTSDLEYNLIKMN